MNKGLMGNFIFAIKQARGKYLAFCDADDYWTDKNKLTFQTDIIRNNSKLSMVGALMHFQDLRNEIPVSYGEKYLENLSEGILESSAFFNLNKVPFHISSFICINDKNTKNKLKKFRFSASNDIVLWCILLDMGDCYLSQKIVGIENHIENGITHIQNHISLSYRLNRLIMWNILYKELKCTKLKTLSCKNYFITLSDFKKRLLNSNLKMAVGIFINKNYPVGVFFFVLKTWLVLKLKRRIYSI
jgi:glycosyltransferase involved in cell wall biosynthesis